jgi:hypothetical protein
MVTAAASSSTIPPAHQPLPGPAAAADAAAIFPGISAASTASVLLGPLSAAAAAATAGEGAAVDSVGLVGGREVLAAAAAARDRAGEGGEGGCGGGAAGGAAEVDKANGDDNEEQAGGEAQDRAEDLFKEMERGGGMSLREV